MQLHNKLYLAIALAFALVNNIAHAQPELEQTRATTTTSQYANAAKPILVRSSKPTFEIKLSSNPTTGYQWYYLADRSDGLITPTKQFYSKPPEKLLGASGADIWSFKASPKSFKVPTISKITLVYARSGELDKPVKTLRLTVVTAI